MGRFAMFSVMALVVALAGCGNSAEAGKNWVFYSWEETSSDGKTTTTSTVEECLNIKFISQATYYPVRAGKDKSTLWINCAGKEIKLYGKDADKIWKQMQSNN